MSAREVKRAAHVYAADIILWGMRHEGEDYLALCDELGSAEVDRAIYEIANYHYRLGDGTRVVPPWEQSDRADGDEL